MTDRPIIFSPPMVRALLAGRKTQTRRLATSPLRRVEVGDRLYVRERWRVSSAQDDVAPRDLPRDLSVEYMPLGDATAWVRLNGKPRPSIHMPRWASRLTLTVEAVRVGPLNAISDANARAEGISEFPAEGPHRQSKPYYAVERGDGTGRMTATWAFADLWNSLHDEDGQRWRDNPDVVALTFSVERRNIDAPLSPIHVDGGDR